MKNSRASSLVIALSMMVLFTGLGLGALNYAGRQGQDFVHQTLSTQAFWLAEAGLQQSIASGETSATASLGNGTFNVPTPVTNGNSVTITSTGTVNGVQRTLQAVGTVTNVFSENGGANALVTGTSGTTLVLSSGDNMGTYNSNTNTSPSLTGGVAGTEGSSSTVVNSSGVTPATGVKAVLPPVTVPTPPGGWQNCPGQSNTTSPWNVTANTTFTTPGYYECSYLYVASGATLTITNTPTNLNNKVVLYLTAADPATVPPDTNGEDLRGNGSFPSNLGIVKVLSGASLTVYAAGRMTSGTRTPDTLNTAGTVDFLNQDPYDPAITYSTGAYVTYNDQAWQCHTNCSGNTPGVGSNWTLINYSSTTSYAANAYVTATCSSVVGAYRSIQGSNLNHNPCTSPTWWILSNNPIPANITIESLYTPPSPVTWNSTTTYSTNAVVSYNGGTWESTISNNLNNTPGVSSTYPPWSSSTTYANGADVTYNNQAYQSEISHNTGNTPDSTPPTWSSSITYAQYVVVNYHSGSHTYTYQSLVGSNTGHKPSSSPTYWTQITGTWASTTQPTAAWTNMAWNSTTNYSTGAIVFYAGQIWESQSNNNIGNTPIIGPASNGTQYWNTYAGVEVDNDGKHFYGLIYAPEAYIDINVNETYYGSLVGNAVSIQSGTTIYFDQSLLTNTNTSLPSTFSVTSWAELTN